MILKKILASKSWDYFILAARFLLGWTFLRYGYSKLSAGQFGISPEELATPLEELSLFRVSWYLFDFEPFKTFIGLSQIISGILLIWNRTALIGAFFFIPIVLTILIIDLTFMPTYLANSFAWRLGYYLFLDGLIILHYRDRIMIMWNAISSNIGTNYKFKFHFYLLLPLVAIIMEFLSPNFFFRLFSSPIQTISGLGELFVLIVETIKQVF